LSLRPLILFQPNDGVFTKCRTAVFSASTDTARFEELRRYDAALHDSVDRQITYWVVHRAPPSFHKVFYISLTLLLIYPLSDVNDPRLPVEGFCICQTNLDTGLQP
jgi:hypothetical protein